MLHQEAALLAAAFLQGAINEADRRKKKIKVKQRDGTWHLAVPPGRHATSQVPVAPGTWNCTWPGAWGLAKWHLVRHLAPGTWHLAPGTWHLAPSHDAVILPWHLGLGAGIIAECRICPAVATTIALCTCSS